MGDMADDFSYGGRCAPEDDTPEKEGMTLETTPRPWEFLPDEDNEGGDLADRISAGSIYGGGMHIARIWADGNAPEADAALIIEAVNSFDSLRSEVSLLRSELEMLKKALAPFADFARQLPMAGKFDDNATVYQYDDSTFTVGDLKRAAEALQP